MQKTGVIWLALLITLSVFVNADPDHCSNSIMDKALGEEGVDCNHPGGPCAQECQFYVNSHPRILLDQNILDEARCKVGTVGYESYCSHFGILTVQFQRLVNSVDDDIYYNRLTMDKLRNSLPACVLSLQQGHCDYVKRILSANYDVGLSGGGRNGNEIFFGDYNGWAVAYDWMYDQLTPEERQQYGQVVLLRAQNYDGYFRNVGYPHLLFPEGFAPFLAIYGDGFGDTLAYNNIVEFLNYIYVLKIPVYDEIYTDGEMWGYGTSSDAYYSTGISLQTGLSQDMWDRSSHVRNIAYFRLYRYRPDRLSADFIGKYNPLYADLKDISIIHSYFYRDQVIKKIADEYLTLCGTTLCQYIFFLYYDPSLAAGSFASLELSKHFRGLDTVYYRSDWKLKNADPGYAASIHGFFYNGAKMDGWLNGIRNHFIISRGDDSLLITQFNFLARDDFYYITNWFRRGISRNTLLVYDPEESYGNYVSGGQNLPYGNDGGECFTCGDLALGAQKYPIATGYGLPVRYTGELSRYDDQSAYMYIRGSDAKYAFSPGKVNEWTREFVYLRPDVFVVFDRVDAQATLQKKLLFHPSGRPVLDGSETIALGSQYGGVFESTDSTSWQAERGNSKLFAKTILPESPKISRIGGANAYNNEFVQSRFSIDPIGYDVRGDSYEWWYDNHNNPPTPVFDFQQGWNAYYTDQERLTRNDDPVTPAGDWRIEVEYPQSQQHELFLHVLWATANTASEMLPTQRITSEELEGVLIDNRQAVIFTKESGVVMPAEFTINGGGLIDFIMVGMVPGAGYAVQLQDHTITVSSGSEYQATDQGVLTFSLTLGDAPDCVSIGGQCLDQCGHFALCAQVFGSCAAGMCCEGECSIPCHPADINCNAVISNQELMGFVQEWLAGRVGLQELIDVMALWKYTG
ncbi:MAG: hypothetical protein ABIJ21_08495 [Nanoarchaeota archaeon]